MTFFALSLLRSKVPVPRLDREKNNSARSSGPATHLWKLKRPRQLLLLGPFEASSFALFDRIVLIPRFFPAVYHFVRFCHFGLSVENSSTFVGPVFYVCLVAVLIWISDLVEIRSEILTKAPTPVVASDGDGYNYKAHESWFDPDLLPRESGDMVTFHIRQVFPDGSRYEGQWKDGLKHGKAGGRTATGRDWHQVACYGNWGVIVQKSYQRSSSFDLSMTLHDLNLTWTKNHLPGSLHIPRRRCLWWPLPWTLSAINSSIFQKWLRGGIRKIKVDSGV